jgi:hypothetical protein
MYCPRCSQQQVSEEMRFCSRCGLPLSVVKELVAGGGGLVEREVEAQVGQPSPALRGMRKGVWIMLAGVPLALVVALLTAVNDAFAVFLLLPVLCLVAGFARLLYGTFLEGRAPRVKRDASEQHAGSMMPSQPRTAARAPELSPPAGTPVEGFTAPKLETAEMVRPPSVTEHTTRLLDEDSDPRLG